MHLTNNSLLREGNGLKPSFHWRPSGSPFSLAAWKLAFAFSSPAAAQSSSPAATLPSVARNIAAACLAVVCSWRIYITAKCVKSQGWIWHEIGAWKFRKYFIDSFWKSWMNGVVLKRIPSPFNRIVTIYSKTNTTFRFHVRKGAVIISRFIPKVGFACDCFDAIWKFKNAINPEEMGVAKSYV